MNESCLKIIHNEIQEDFDVIMNISPNGLLQAPMLAQLEGKPFLPAGSDVNGKKVLLIDQDLKKLRLQEMRDRIEDLKEMGAEVQGVFCIESAPYYADMGVKFASII